MSATTKTDQRSILWAAIQSHVAGIVDGEQRSELDLLLTNIVATADRSAWKAAMLDLLGATGTWGPAHWRAIEYLVIFGELIDPKIVAVLEDLIRNQNIKAAPSRGSAYSILSQVNSPMAPKVIFADTELKKAMPLFWLDLLLPLLPSREEQQRIILEAVEQKHLNVSEIAVRFTDIRLAGGSRLGAWLLKLRDALPNRDQTKFAKLIGELGMSIERVGWDIPKRNLADFRETMSRFRTSLDTRSKRYAPVAAHAP